MSDRFFDYDAIISDALRGVMRKILESVASSGLPTGHHYYITFRTGDEGVCLSDHMKAQHPEEMTIVLQHRFWGLKVDEDRFEVGLSFNQRPETIIIPYQAVVAFVDPSAEFALQFELDQLEDGQLKKGLGGDKTDNVLEPERIESAPREDAAAPEADTVSAETASEEAELQPENKVVTLDAFRKKR